VYYSINCAKFANPAGCGNALHGLQFARFQTEPP
jgi:hypothetical protein